MRMYYTFLLFNDRKPSMVILFLQVTDNSIWCIPWNDLEKSESQRDKLARWEVDHTLGSWSMLNSSVASRPA
jgi:hypothetical protein